MSEKITPPTAPERKTPVSLRNPFEGLGKIVERVYMPFLESFLPKPHYLEGENIQKVIRMSPYRAQVARTMGIIGMVLLLPGLIALLVAFMIAQTSAQMVASGFSIVGLLILFESVQGWLAYHQWQFIITDKRIILVTPDPDRKGFADTIYLKRGKIQVLDTNFSTNPIWGLFQMLQGSRDVMLSMGGYEFMEQGAKVKGGLRFPDVRPEDISFLEELIFS